MHAKTIDMFMKYEQFTITTDIDFDNPKSPGFKAVIISSDHPKNGRLINDIKKSINVVLEENFGGLWKTNFLRNGKESITLISKQISKYCQYCDFRYRIDDS